MRAIIVFMLLFLSVIMSAQSTETIIENYFKAIGGKERLSRLHSLEADLNMSTMGTKMVGEILYQAPDKKYTEFSVMGARIVSVFDGEHGWIINPLSGSEKPMPMTAEEIEEAKRNVLTDILLNHHQHKIENLGSVGLNGASYLALKINAHHLKDPITRYFDPNTFMLIYESTTSEEQGTIFIHYTDYREFSGLKIATSQTTYVGDDFEAPLVEMQLSGIAINKKVEGAIFSKPSK